MKRILIAIVVLVCSCEFAQAGYLDSLIIGAGGGVTNFESKKFEISTRKVYTSRKNPYELSFGMNYRTFEASFDSLGGLTANSIGLFAGVDIFLYKGIFVGLRWDVATYNWLNSASEDRFKERGKDYTPGPFMGMAFSFLAGFDAYLADRWNLRFLWQGGMHNYKISNGSFTVWNYSKDSKGATKREGFFNYVQSICVILEYQLTN